MKEVRKERDEWKEKDAVKERRKGRKGEKR